MIKPKILIVGSFPKPKKKIYGGIAKSCKLLIESNIFNDFKIIKLDSSQISHPPPNFFIRLILSVFRMIKFLIKLLIDKPNVVLIFCSDGASSIEKGIMIFLSKLFNSKAVIFPRAGNLINQVEDNYLFSLSIKFLFNKSDVFLCQGIKWKQFAINKLKITPSKVKIINNWSATEDLLNIGENRIISEEPKKIKILFVGWLEKAKGISQIIQSFKRLIDKKNNIELIIVGDGSMKKELEKLLVQKKYRDKIKLKGWLNDKALRQCYQDSDMFILPSWYEGMPNSLIEATATGLPSISTDVGMVSDYYNDKENMLIIDLKNQNILTNSIEKLINDVNLRKNIAKNGMLVSKKIFSTKINLNKLSKIINE
tara:strand:- start:6193 stop:7296 length:1104 start_codon:yes stop_codon:yes gene_type:complete